MALDLAEHGLGKDLEGSSSFYASQSWATEFASSLIFERQEGRLAKRQEYSAAGFVVFEMSQSTFQVKTESKEPVYETSFSIKPANKISLHKGDIGEKPEKLDVGGSISKKNSLIKIELDNADSIVFDTTTGKAKIDSLDRYQKEVHYKGTPWQTTVYSSDHNKRISFGPDHIKSIESDGEKEVFSHFSPKIIGSEPRLPSNAELSRLFKMNGRIDLENDLENIDRKEQAARSNPETTNGSTESLKQAWELEKQRASLLEKAVGLLQADPERLHACAEQQLRSALKELRSKYGAGTPESKEHVDALKDLLVQNQDPEQEEEIQRLEFESRRAKHMERVMDNLSHSPASDIAHMAPGAVDAIRKSLISIHIAVGDPGLKTFVKELNERLSGKELLAPPPRTGFLKPGVVWLTPEGATRYNGDFQIQRSK